MEAYVHMYLYLSTYVRCSLIFRAIFAVFYGTIDWQFFKLQVQVLNFQLFKHTHTHIKWGYSYYRALLALTCRKAAQIKGGGPEHVFINICVCMCIYVYVCVCM